MSLLYILFLLPMVIADKGPIVGGYSYIQPKHQYDNFQKGQPPSGPEHHHFFGQGGFDPYGKKKAPLPIYDYKGVSNYPVEGNHPYDYEVYGGYDDKDKDKGLFKYFDDKFKEYSDKFNKFVKGYVSYSEPVPTYEYAPSYYEPTYYEPTYEYYEPEKEKSLGKKIKDEADKLKHGFESLGDKAYKEFKKMEEDVKKKFTDLFKKEKEPSYAYGVPSSYGAPIHYEEEESLTKKLGKEIAKGASKIKYDLEKMGEKAAKELSKLEDEASKKWNKLSHILEKVDGFVQDKVEKELEKGQKKLEKFGDEMSPILHKIEYKTAKEWEKLQNKAEKERLKVEAKATKKLKELFESDYEYDNKKSKGYFYNLFKKDKDKKPSKDYVEEYDIPIEVQYSYVPPVVHPGVSSYIGY